MKKKMSLTTVLTAAAVLVLLSVWPVNAQIATGNGRGPGDGTGSADCNGPLYFDPATVDTFSGTISVVYGLYCQTGDTNFTGNGMHYLFTTTGGEQFYAMTGPFWFLDDSGIEMTEGAGVKLTGSVVAAHGTVLTDHDYLIVTRIVIGGETVDVRDADGLPLWKGDPAGGYYKAPEWAGSRCSLNVTVESVRTRSNGQYNDAGLELVVRTKDQQRLRVYLGPQYYCEQLGVAVKAGDQIRLRGMQQDRDMVCQQLTGADGATYKFRARNGNPLWQR